MGRKKKEQDKGIDNLDVVELLDLAEQVREGELAVQDERIVRAARSAAQGYAFADDENSVVISIPIEGDVLTLKIAPRGARAFANSIHAAADVADDNSEDDDF